MVRSCSCSGVCMLPILIDPQSCEHGGHLTFAFAALTLLAGLSQRCVGKAMRRGGCSVLL